MYSMKLYQSSSLLYGCLSFAVVPPSIVWSRMIERNNFPLDERRAYGLHTRRNWKKVMLAFVCLVWMSIIALATIVFLRTSTTCCIFSGMIFAAITSDTTSTYGHVSHILEGFK
ncbi:uncharacterized protein LOC131302595 [Rhododendron vialii]|uniref:uncharacterized protein LOC131302595 n=1 Tax=Rhododendron vialii TaxID=182163 RepID=UPI00266040BF|nr:uncharacterized protein LOC131302595 [Rhododendron vialii]